jgi:hypothetical protein
MPVRLLLPPVRLLLSPVRLLLPPVRLLLSPVRLLLQRLGRRAPALTWCSRRSVGNQGPSLMLKNSGVLSSTSS